MTTAIVTDTVLRLDNVSRTFPGTPPVEALKSTTLEIRRGEFVGIVGPSGSGKSTMLNLIGALDVPSTGHVVIDGFDVGEMSDAEVSALRGQRIGFVFQTFNLIDGLTALDNVAVGLTYAGVGRAERARRAVDALESVGLGHRMTHRPTEMSGGERQRVAIARAIVGKPALLLADEPTGNLDSVTSESIISIFRELHGAGATIALITHDPELADLLPRTVTLRDGQIVQDSARV